jgi:hypothetical protein
LVVAAVISVAPSAAAAPRCLEPLRDRYEPGAEVTVVGYGCVRERSRSGPGENLVVSGYLHVMPDPCAGVDSTMYCNRAGLLSEGPPVDPASGIPLGRLSLEESPHPRRGLRASLTFRIPTDLAPGTYYILTCDQPCAVDEWAHPTWPWPRADPSRTLNLGEWPTFAHLHESLATRRGQWRGRRQVVRR